MNITNNLKNGMLSCVITLLKRSNIKNLDYKYYLIEGV